MRLSNLPALLTTTLAIALLSVAARAAPPPSPVVITPINDRDFRERVLVPHAGKVVLVNFWATYCLPCLEELPGLIKLEHKLAKRGVDFVYVNTDPPGSEERVRAVLAKRAVALAQTFVVTNEDPQPFIDTVDPSWAGQVPYQVLYGRDGARLKSLAGQRPLAEIELAILAALGPEAPRAAEPTSAP